jgi:hypothetical protein
MFTSQKEQEFFFSHLNKTQKVLEWGSGESTSQIAQKVKQVVSVEHDIGWYTKTKDTLPSNVTYHLREPEWPWQWSTPQPYDQFKTYIEEPLQNIDDALFDIVFIDGVSRENCASVCKVLTHEKSLVFIHDFVLSIRKNYVVALDYLEKIDQVESMALFTVKR